MVKLGYESSVNEFKNDNNNYILGELTKNYNFELRDLQKNAWISQINILKDQLSTIDNGDIIFEYTIPRMGSIIYNVLLIDGLVFIIEFKVGETEYKKADLDQLENYIKILKNYHYESRDNILIPILVATEAETTNNQFELHENNIFSTLKSNKENLYNIIILEAARKLYETHEVEDIKTYSSDDLFLAETEQSIDQIITNSKNNNQKSIIFLTGVPGAGKTLIGLNTATKRSVTNDEPAVFLSGNGPLVKVLQEALARDSSKRNNITKNAAKLKVISFIQPIHQFRDDAIDNDDVQHEKIVIFDEAQRAWTQDQTETFMKNKKQIENFGMSEPEFLISIMDRQKIGQ